MCATVKSAQLLYKKVLIDVFSASPFSDGASVRIVLKMAGKCAHIKPLNQSRFRNRFDLGGEKSVLGDRYGEINSGTRVKRDRGCSRRPGM